MDLLVPSGFLPLIIIINIILLIIAMSFILRYKGRFSDKVVAFLMSLLIPVLGSIIVIIAFRCRHKTIDAA